MFTYGLVQVCVWAILDNIFMFWALKFPFSYRQLLLSGRIHLAHIISATLGLFIPMPAALVQLVDGYTIIFAPPLTCNGRNIDHIYYTLILPISVVIGITTLMQMIIVWTIFKVLVIFRI